MTPAEKRCAAVQAKLARRELPRLHFERVWYADGNGLPCHGCEDMIMPAETQVRVVAFANTLTLRLHAGCFVCWRDEVKGWQD
jgi:hypothetical protein